MIKINKNYIAEAQLLQSMLWSSHGVVADLESIIKLWIEFSSGVAYYSPWHYVNTDTVEEFSHWLSYKFEWLEIVSYLERDDPITDEDAVDVTYYSANA